MNAWKSNILKVITYAFIAIVFYSAWYFCYRYISDKASTDPTAKKITTALSVMADSLILAEKTGDTAGAFEVMQAAIRLQYQFDSLSDVDKKNVLSTNLRYCYIAIKNIRYGAEEVDQGSYWSEKKRFYNAIKMCR